MSQLTFTSRIRIALITRGIKFIQAFAVAPKRSAERKVAQAEQEIRTARLVEQEDLKSIQDQKIAAINAAAEKAERLNNAVREAGFNRRNKAASDRSSAITKANAYEQALGAAVDSIKPVV